MSNAEARTESTAGVTGAVAGWLTGPVGVAALVGAAGAALVWRSLWRHRNGGACCIDASEAKEMKRG